MYSSYCILTLYISIVSTKSNAILFRASQIFSSILKATELPRNGQFSLRYRDESAASHCNDRNQIVRENIERNKTAINAQHQTIRERNKHISRRQSGARESGAPRIPK